MSAGERDVRTAAVQAGDLISGSLAHGANTLQSSGFSPTEEETEQARRELAVAATRTAMAQARAVAEAAGERVLAVREIAVTGAGGFSRVPMPASFARAAAPAPAPPVAIEAGEQDVSITVNVKIAIAPMPG